MRIAQEEIFGPVVSVIPCRSFEEAVEIGNDVPYGLSASIYTQDVNAAFAAMRDLYTGIFYVNAPTIGAEVHLPFGGTKATGNGHREAGTAALDVFSEWKSIYVDFSGRLQRAQIDTVEIWIENRRIGELVNSRADRKADCMSPIPHSLILQFSNSPILQLNAMASQSSPETASASRSRPRP